MEFHSERELEAKRAEKRQAREQILNEVSNWLLLLMVIATYCQCCR